MEIYGFMDAREQEQDQNLYISMKVPHSIVGDKGLGQEPGTVSVDVRAFRVYASRLLTPVERGLPGERLSPPSIVVSDLLWVLVRTGGRRISLRRSSAAKVAGLQRDTEDGGPVAPKERWSQDSLESEQDIPQIDLGVEALVWGNAHWPIEESVPSEGSHWTNIPTVATG